MYRQFTIAALAASLFTIVEAHNTNDQIGANISYGSFQDPSVYVRPKFRYWIPDASVNLSRVTEDFARFKEIGMGGAELLGYYFYGEYPNESGPFAPLFVDWTIYGWGTEAWNALAQTALEATKRLGLVMDFALGPNQGSGVPAEYDDEGIMWDLVPFNITVPKGGSYSGILPGWGTGELVAATTGLVLSNQSVVLSALPDFVPATYNGSHIELSASSLTDVTSKVDSSTGHISLAFPNTQNGTAYQLFAFYQKHGVTMEQGSPLYIEPAVQQSPVTSFRENGSRVNDHFSLKGANMIIDFWEKYLLSYEDIRELILEVGNYAWEDSQEFGSGIHVWWTPGLPEAFKAARGYSISKYLPLIFYPDAEIDAPLPSINWYQTNEADAGQGHIDDYRQTLTELNHLYLEAMTNWSTTSLQSQYSAQVVYNLPMDMLANVPAVNAPECESLGFDHVIDGYRQFSGPANLAGKRIISSELGAESGEVYNTTLPTMIWEIKRSIVGSVNQFVLHAFPYSGSYPNTTWPGFTTFSYLYSSMHGPRQPTWDYYDDFMNWIARMQYVAQSGVPKTDLAFWLKQSAYFTVPTQYAPNDLVTEGFTYGYLSPDNLVAEPEAYVQNGVLAPDRQAFKALILRQNDTLTVEGVQKLVQYANAGLTIVFSGGVPSKNGTGAAYVSTALAGIVKLKNVHIVPYDNLAVSLQELGLTPRTKVEASSIWYTYWREDAAASKSYVFVYNDASMAGVGPGSSDGSITFATTGVPYLYDAWTGAVTRVFAYSQTNTTTTIHLTLADDESAIIGFHHAEQDTLSAHPLSLPSSFVSVTSSGNDCITLLSTASEAQTLPFSDGKSYKLAGSTFATQNLTRWNLIVESWSQPSDPIADQTQPVLNNMTFSDVELEAWSSISESLTNVSGRGFYTTTFTWPPTSSSYGAKASGALLDLGTFTNTARAWVNGHQLLPLDPTRAVADIGSYLNNGKNQIEIVVGTPLGNVLNPIWEELMTSGRAPLGAVPALQDYGLVSPVLLRPYVSSTITL